ncbi:MAG: 5'-methylthioadenosine/S-adenosylhomocysteine nucleosidase [Intestinimonas sp.]|jgi:adenosylhomocysteine nucleosidase|nr:5'-methylthioadenosine/S-adenosylhomocysteine nucleosidase [Intestinimonas sp.]
MNQAPILLQGAEEHEISGFLCAMSRPDRTEVGGYSFWHGRIGAQNTVIAQTDIGLIHAACATVLGILTFHPAVVINQGTAGAAVRQLHRGDIVIGSQAVNLDALNMPPRPKDTGCAPFDWTFNGRSAILNANPAWVSRLTAGNDSAGILHVGRLGSGDLFSREADRIDWLHAQRGHLCEDMESAAVYQACTRLDTPCVGVRIISNNELTREPYEEPVAADLQRFLLDTLFTSNTSVEM